MVKASAAEGVMIRLAPQGGISLKGDSGAVSRWSAVLKSHKPELIAYLTNEKTVTDWLDQIGEDDLEIIDTVLARSRTDPVALTEYLWLANRSVVLSPRALPVSSALTPSGSRQKQFF